MIKISYRIPVLLSLLLPFFATADDQQSPGSCHSGAYGLSDGSQMVIQPSVDPDLRYRRLDGSTGRLYPVGGNSYESGDGWAVRKPVTLNVTFGACDEGIIHFQPAGKPALEGRKIALPTIPITFSSEGQTLYGELVMPAGGKPRAIVVLQYGGGRDSAVANNFVQHLLPLRDIAVFVFDKRGTGRSTGKFNAHIAMLADDLVAAVQAVRARPELEDVPLGLMGESQGGWVAPLAATRTPVDFVVVSYGLAVSMLEEDRQEVIQSLREQGYGAEVLAKGEEIHRAAARVMVSRFSEGLDELERLKSAYRDEPWFPKLRGDFTSPLTSTLAERMPDLQEVFNFPYDLEYDPIPTIRKLTVPQLWILAGSDTEAPHETTLANLRKLQAHGSEMEVIVFPDAEHGMMAVERKAGRTQLAGRMAEGYFELLFDWIGRQSKSPVFPERN